MATNAIEVPVDSYIERLLIGSILVCSGKSMDGMRATLETPDFGLEAHRRIWDAMCTLYDASGSLDHATLARELQRRSQLESVGGLAYLVDLEEGMPEYPCLDQYVDKLKDTGLARRILVLIDHLQKRVASGLETGAELREALVASVSDLMPTASKDHRPVSTAELVDQLGVDELMSPRMEEGVRLPWGRLNAALHGLRGGQSVVLAADTGRGKTCLACQISTHITRQGRSVLYWTMEMPPRALFRRMVNQMTGTDRRHAKPTFESREMEREAVGWLYEHPIYFDQHSRTVPGFCASIRQVQHQTKLGLIVVDYLGLIRAAGRAESRTREVGENSRSLKLAAMDFDLPFLVLSQYRRSGGDDRPTIHSLKDSGDVENDADVVLLLNSPGLVPGADTAVDIHVGKQREGPAGFNIPLIFRPASQSFQSPDNDPPFRSSM